MKLSNHSKSSLTTQSVNHKYTSVFRFLQFLIIVIIGASITGFSTPSAQACKCTPLLSPQQSVERFAMVFRGKVLSVKIITFLPEGYQYRQVRFMLKHLWKGENQRHATLSTEMDNGNCGYSFTKGKEYLVYSHISLYNLTKCSRTKPWLSVGREELEQLGKGQDIVGN
jgi:hypothetical protein